MVDQTPKEISHTVREFCRSINPRAKPLFLPVDPVRFALRDECFQNVANLVDSDGGEILFGWAIWTWPTVWLKAEHHAVWRRNDRSVVDVTPHINQVDKVLFLPDEFRVYDFETNQRLDNIRKALRNDADIQTLFDIEQVFHNFQEAHTVDGGLTMRVDPRKYLQLVQMKNTAYLTLLRKYLKRNDPCPCLSGKKLKQCGCGKFEFKPHTNLGL